MADDLRTFRLRHGLTQAAFGARVRPPMDKADVSKIENGKKRPGPVLAVRLADAMRAIEDEASLPAPARAGRLEKVKTPRAGEENKS